MPLQENLNLDNLPNEYDLSGLPDTNTTTIEPAPFKVDDHFNEWNKTQPVEKMADNKNGFSKVLHYVADPYIAGGYNFMSALNRGAAYLGQHLDSVADYMEMSGAGKKEGLFGILADYADKNADELKKVAEEKGIGYLNNLVTNALGQAVPGVTEFVIDLATGGTFPYMSAAAETQKRNEETGEKGSPLVNGLVAAATTKTLGALFRIISPLQKYLQAPIMGTVFGGQAAIEAPEGQKIQAFLEGGSTGSLFALTAPGGQLGMNDIKKMNNDLLAKYKRNIKDINSLNEEGALRLPTKEEVETVYQNVFNRFASIENLDKKAEVAGVKIQPGDSPAMRAREYLGISEKVQSVLQDKTYKINPDGKIEITGEGLKPIIDAYDKASPETDIGIRTQEFNDYFISRRTVEDLQRPKSEFNQDNIVTEEQVSQAQTKLQNLRTKYGNLDHFDAVADRFYEYQKRVLHMLVDSGNLSENSFKDILNKNPHYVPFDRVMEGIEPSSGVGGRTKKPFDEARSPIKKIKGSELKIHDVVGSVIKNTYRIMDTAERNTVARNVAKLADTLPGDIESVRPTMRPIKVNPQEIDTVTMQFRQQAQQVKESIKRTSTGTSSEPSSAPISKLESIVIDALQHRGMTEGEANVYVNKIKSSAVNKTGSETTATTETIEKTIDHIIKETVSILEMPVESTIFRPSPFKPKGNVVEYYDQGQKKYIDVSENLYSAMTGMNDLSSDLLVRIFSTPAHLLRIGTTVTPEFVLRNFVRDQYDAFIQTQVGFRPAIDTVGAVADVIGKSDAYYDWMRSGGAHSTFIDLSRKNLDRVAKSLQGDESVFRYLNVIHDAQSISQAIEKATRLGVYKASIRAGKTPVEAGFISREGTVDFGVRGESKGLKTFSSMTAFFNPAIQGLDRFVRAHKENPLSIAGKAVASITIPSLLLWFLNKDDKGYQELPTWQKDLFWMIRVGKDTDMLTWARIPKPFLFGQIYGSAVERFMDYVNERDNRAIGEFAKTLLSAATPIQGDPSGSILPTAVKPLIENSTNWSFFKEVPIIPESKKDLMPYLQYNKYTTDTAKIIGKRLNWSPAKIENFIQGVTGTTGRYALEATDYALDILGESKKGKRPKELADIPGIKGFVTRPVESSPQSLSDFYKKAEKITQEYNSYRKEYQDTNMKEANELMKKHPAIILYPSIQSARDEISKLNEQIEAVSESKVSDDIKRKRIRALERQRMNIAKIRNQNIDKIEGNK